MHNSLRAFEFRIVSRNRIFFSILILLKQNGNQSHRAKHLLINQCAVKYNNTNNMNEIRDLLATPTWTKLSKICNNLIYRRSNDLFPFRHRSGFLDQI